MSGACWPGGRCLLRRHHTAQAHAIALTQKDDLVPTVERSKVLDIAQYLFPRVSNGYGARHTVAGTATGPAMRTQHVAREYMQMQHALTWMESRWEMCTVRAHSAICRYRVFER